VLLSFIKLIFGNRCRPGVSPQASQWDRAHDSEDSVCHSVVAVEVTYTHANEPPVYPYQKTLMNVNSACASFVFVSRPTLETEIRNIGTLRGKGFLLSCLTQGDTET